MVFFPEKWRYLPVGVVKGKGKGARAKGKGMGQYWVPSWPSWAPGTGRNARPATPFVVVPTLNTSQHLKPLPHKSRPPVAPPEVQASPLNLHMWELGFRGPFTAPFTAPLRPRPPHCKFPPVPPPRPPLVPAPWNNLRRDPRRSGLPIGAMPGWEGAFKRDRNDACNKISI